MEKVFTVLGWFVLATLSLAIARQLSEQKNIYLFPDSFGEPYARHGQENFTSGPADLNLKKPYTLLEAAPAEKAGGLTAESCYDKDFLAHTQKTGDYTQKTNNFLHAAPDSCSSPRTEFVNSFYQ